MKRRNSPSLNSLRAFEAVGRHLSQTQAAAELCVTTPAVAQQVRKLQSTLELELIRHDGGKPTLTNVGAALLKELTAAFDHIDAAIEKARHSGGRETVTVAACPDFSAKWLVSRLRKFYAVVPDIDISVVPLGNSGAPRLANVDIALPYAHSAAGAKRIFGETLFPVCSPSFCNANTGDCEEIIRRNVVLHDASVFEDGPLPGWQAWLEEAGMQTALGIAGPSLSPSNVAIDAAVDGWGIALGRSVLVQDHLAAGELVRLSTVQIDANKSYFAVTSRRGAKRPAVRTFQDWLTVLVEEETQQAADSWSVGVPMAPLMPRSPEASACDLWP
jgi:LysR family glycine cleavage system transcriptional activator